MSKKPPHLLVLAARSDDARFAPGAVATLDKGIWQAKAIRNEANPEFSAWTAWSDKHAWLTSFAIWSPQLRNANPEHGREADRIRVDKHVLSDTIEEALARARPARFSISAPATVLFFIDDTFNDNQGGVTIELNKVSDTPD